MPRYTFRCRDCGRVREIQRRIAERDDTSQCSCGGVYFRSVDAPALKFNGPGWTPTFHPQQKGKR